MIDVKETLLFKFVEEKSPEYYKELIKLRTHAEHWLSNINTTFPHYPSHGIDHSDQIIQNISLILFKNADSSTPVAKQTWKKIEDILSNAGSATDVADKSEQLFLASVSQRHLFSQRPCKSGGVCFNHLYLAYPAFP